MQEISNLRIPLSLIHSEKEEKKELERKLTKQLGYAPTSFQIMRRSLDARKGREPSFLYTVRVFKKGETAEDFLRKPLGVNTAHPKERPIVVGFGPAGMFAALSLARAGLKPLVLERGKNVQDRTQDVENFFKGGKLLPNSNVQFGEGGAGAFSDGKLTTTVHDRDGLMAAILHDMVRFGAPEEIEYEAKPHIGTDRLKPMCRAIREEIIRLDGEVRFESCFDDFVLTDGRLSAVIYTDAQGCSHRETATAAFLGLGHSARDSYEMLNRKGMELTPKAFAVGYRVEHPQELIDENQYHGFAGHPLLDPASYKLTYTAEDGRGVYSFCMCPGGHIIPASSEVGGACVNGMSYYARDGKNANSAILMTVTPEDYASYKQNETDPLGGMRMQRALEEKAFALSAGTYRTPVQRLEDYENNRATKALNMASANLGEVYPCNIRGLLPAELEEDFISAMHAFDGRIPGFAGADVVLSAVESRSSAPVRIVRDEKSRLATRADGIYPIGEGAGYAGGIMSSAMDGILSAEAYISSLN